MKKVEVAVNKIGDKGADVMFQNVRITFVYLDSPAKDIDGDPDKGKYSVTCIIPAAEFPAIEKKARGIFEQVLKLNAKLTDPKKRKEAFDKAVATGKKGAFFKLGDEQKNKNTGVVYKGLEDAFTFTATVDAVKGSDGNFRPKFDIALKDRKAQTVPEHLVKSEFYSGCFAHVAVLITAFDFRGNLGMKAYLNGVLKTADGEKLSGVDPFAAYVPPADEEEAATDFTFGEEEEAPKGKGAGKGRK